MFDSFAAREDRSVVRQQRRLGPAAGGRGSARRFGAAVPQSRSVRSILRRSAFGREEDRFVPQDRRVGDRGNRWKHRGGDSRAAAGDQLRWHPGHDDGLGRRALGLRLEGPRPVEGAPAVGGTKPAVDRRRGGSGRSAGEAASGHHVHRAANEVGLDVRGNCTRFSSLRLQEQSAGVAQVHIECKRLERSRRADFPPEVLQEVAARVVPSTAQRSLDEEQPADHCGGSETGRKANRSAHHRRRDGIDDPMPHVRPNLHYKWFVESNF